MKKTLLLAVLFVCVHVSAQVEIKSGLVVGSGIGALHDTRFKASSGVDELAYKNPDAAIGYKFRLLPTQKRFFYDLDILVGLKRFDHWQNRNSDLQYNPTQTKSCRRFLRKEKNH
ncbi:MAG: hypothetical protein LBQ78_02130 [Tannerellaceae bacterium]|nr:hypothetical protein [Tannerellaceae bacterium]